MKYFSITDSNNQNIHIMQINLIKRIEVKKNRLIIHFRNREKVVVHHSQSKQAVADGLESVLNGYPTSQPDLPSIGSFETLDGN